MRKLPSFGAGASAGAAPIFVFGAASTSNGQTLTGIITGDLVLAIVASNTQFPTAPIGWALEVSGGALAAGSFVNIYSRIVRPQDTTTLSVNNGSAGSVGMAAFRRLLPIDGLATVAQGVSTAPISGSFTNTIANGFAVNLVGFDATAGTGVFTGSTGYTLACTNSAIAGTRFGCAIEYKQLTAPGVVPASSGAVLGASGDWAVYALAIHP